MNLLDALAQKHNDWINMALSFKITREQANDLVQGMYLKMHKYVKDVDRIMYSEDEVNTFYVYKCLDSMHKSLYHLTLSGKSYNTKNISVGGQSAFQAICKSEYSEDDFLEDYVYEDESIGIIEDNVELHLLFESFLANYRDDYRQMVVEHLLEKRSLREIAKDHGVSHTTVGNKVKSCLVDFVNSLSKKYKYERV